jgi:NTP pyrophosphatase (non-canonical NTP hydrolase)
MNNLEKLEQSVIQWAEDKGIFEKATPYKQAQKTLEECGELLHAIGQQEASTEFSKSYKANCEVLDSIGDIAVTIIIQAKMQGYTLEECLQSAYDVIKNRTGKMVNGQFVKDK